jgi:hypothetical protein
MEGIKMHKDLVNSVNDSEFSKIVRSSTSINEVATRLGFKHNPGKNSKDKIKKRILDLNLSLKEVETVEVVKFQNTSNYNTTTDVGNIGDSKFVFEAAQLGLKISKPVFEGYPYDYVLETKYGFKKIQVKTSEFLNTKDTIRFNITKGVAYKKGRRVNGKYNQKDVDYFYLYCIENNESYLIENPNQTDFVVRLTDSTKNNQHGFNFSKNIMFKDVIKDLL